MSRQHKLTFLFPPEQDRDHPEVHWEGGWSPPGRQRGSEGSSAAASSPVYGSTPISLGEKRVDPLQKSEVHLRRPTLPPSRSLRRLRKKESPPPMRRRLPSLKTGSRLALAAATAIALGIIMGVTVINLFSTGVSQSGSSANDAQHSFHNETLVLPSGYVEDGRLYLPAQGYYLLQAGAYSERKAAEKVQEQLQEQGLAGWIPSGEAPYRIYVGLGRQRSDAERLEAYLEKQGLDVYIHPFQTSEVNSELAGSASSFALLPSYLSRGDRLLETITALAARLLEENGAQLSDDEWQAIQEQHRLFLEEGRQLLNGLEGEHLQRGEELLRALSEAVSALEAYQKQAHPAYLWRAQQAGLTYLDHLDAWLLRLSTM